MAGKQDFSAFYVIFMEIVSDGDTFPTEICALKRHVIFAMANVKSARIRHMVLDRCLREPGGNSIEEMMRRVNKALAREGKRLITAGNTIRNDLTDISNQWNQTIEYSIRRRTFYFSYSNPDFSIYHGQLTLKEMQLVLQALLMLMFCNMEHPPPWLYGMCEEIAGIVGTPLPRQQVILFDEPPAEEGWPLFYNLFESIVMKRVLMVTYHSPPDNSTCQRVIHPYHLRRQDARWQLLGYCAESDCIRCLHLDRIRHIAHERETKYVPNKMNGIMKESYE